MKMDFAQRDVVTWGGIGLAVLAVGYLVIKYAIPAIANAAAGSAAKAAGSVASGVGNTLAAVNDGFSNNALTTGSTDWSGDTVNYTGHGLLSTLGAGANDVSGGGFASLGTGIGGGLFSIFGSAPASSSTYYTVYFPDGSKHAIGDATVDGANNFSYGGVQYRLGDDGYGNHVATPLSTIYGTGAG